MKKHLILSFSMLAAMTAVAGSSNANATVNSSHTGDSIVVGKSDMRGWYREGSGHITRSEDDIVLTPDLLKELRRYSHVEGALSDRLLIVTDDYVDETIGLTSAYGLCDITGREVLAPEYTTVMLVANGSMVKAPSMEGKLHFFTTDGKPVSSKGYYLDYEDDEDFTVLDTLRVFRDGKHGFLTLQGELLPFIYDWTEDFHNGRAEVEKDGKWFVIDAQGHKLADITEPALSDLDEDDYDPIVYENEKHGLRDREGRLTVPCIYDLIEPTYPGSNLFFAVNAQKKRGIIDMHNNVIVPFDYDGYCYVGHDEKHGVYSLSKGGKYGLLSKDYKELTPFVYDVLGNVECDALEEFFAGRDLVRAERDARVGFLDASGSEVIPCLFAWTVTRPAEIMPFCHYEQGKNLFGYADADGRIVYPAVFEKAFEFRHGVAFVGVRAEDGILYEGIIDKFGHTTLPANVIGELMAR